MPSTLSCSAAAAEPATTASRATGSVMSRVIGEMMLPYIKRGPQEVNCAHHRLNDPSRPSPGNVHRRCTAAGSGTSRNDDAGPRSQNGERRTHPTADVDATAGARSRHPDDPDAPPPPAGGGGGDGPSGGRGGHPPGARPGAPPAHAGGPRG